VIMPSESDILEGLPVLLGRLTGLQPEPMERGAARGADLVLRVAGRTLLIAAKGNARSGVLAEAARSVVAEAAAHGPETVPVLAVPYMGDAGKRICEEFGVSFVDLSGNADIRAAPLVVRVQGKPNLFIDRGRPSSVFAPKSSRITRLLLSDAGRWWTQAELVGASSLGRGYVSRICGRLQRDRLIERNEERALRAHDPKLLLRAWQAEYRFDKHEVRRGHVAVRSGDELVDRVVTAFHQHGMPYAMTGLPAAWRLAPFAAHRLVTVYIGKRADESVLASLGWREEAAGANLWLVRPNDESLFQEATEVDGVRCVSPIQAYLDLHAMAMGMPQGMPERSDEAADHLRRELLPWA
jgi:hypothetical protein